MERLTATPGASGMLDAQQLATRLGVTRKAVYRLVGLGLPAVRLGRRALRFDPSRVAAWLRSREVGHNVR